MTKTSGSAYNPGTQVLFLEMALGLERTTEVLDTYFPFAMQNIKQTYSRVAI